MGASNAALTAGVVRTERRRSRVMFNWVRTRNDRSAPRATRRCFCLVLRAAGVLYASGQCSCRTRHSFGAKLVVRCPQRDEVFPSYQSADPRPWSALAPFGGAWRMGASDLPRERSSRFCRLILTSSNSVTAPRCPLDQSSSAVGQKGTPSRALFAKVTALFEYRPSDEAHSTVSATPPSAVPAVTVADTTTIG